jgi:hypothetical protein
MAPSVLPERLRILSIPLATSRHETQAVAKSVRSDVVSRDVQALFISETNTATNALAPGIDFRVASAGIMGAVERVELVEVEGEAGEAPGDVVRGGVVGPVG